MEKLVRSHSSNRIRPKRCRLFWCFPFWLKTSSKFDSQIRQRTNENLRIWGNAVVSSEGQKWQTEPSRYPWTWGITVSVCAYRGSACASMTASLVMFIIRWQITNIYELKPKQYVSSLINRIRTTVITFSLWCCSWTVKLTGCVSCFLLFHQLSLCQSGGLLLFNGWERGDECHHWWVPRRL